MAFFFLGGIFYACLLLVNALAVLNEERFLARIGWSSSSSAPQTYNHGYEPPTEGDSIKARIINLIAAVRTLMRIPLIAINTIVIVYELTLGG